MGSFKIHRAFLAAFLVAAVAPLAACDKACKEGKEFKSTAKTIRDQLQLVLRRPDHAPAFCSWVRKLRPYLEGQDARTADYANRVLPYRYTDGDCSSGGITEYGGREICPHAPGPGDVSFYDSAQRLSGQAHQLSVALPAVCEGAPATGLSEAGTKKARALLDSTFPHLAKDGEVVLSFACGTGMVTVGAAEAEDTRARIAENSIRADEPAAAAESGESPPKASIAL